MSITVLLFIGDEDPGPHPQWVAGGRLAAAWDALQLMQTLPHLDRIIVATPNRQLAEQHTHWPVRWDFDSPGVPFHFGQRLAGLLETYAVEKFFYWGAGSLPLLPRETLAQALTEVLASATPLAITNNPLSSDWLIGNCPDVVRARPQRLERDNMLGPVLAFEAGVEVRGLPASAATRLDIDTPADLLLLSLHPHCGAELADYLRPHPYPQATARWRAATNLLATPGSRVTFIGRVASGVWGYVEKHTRVWTRVFSEERGMSASGRQTAGQVRSLVAAHLAHLGPRAFFDELSQMADLVFFDTRVALAHQHRWPSAADRYASDLGLSDEIEDDFLRELTQAAVNAPIPILLGGHGVVAGDLYGLVEIASGSTAQAPS